MDFRYDINGLRAWAVVAVVFFHFKVSGFSSGFVGVDIFFVISGYLMTRIIVEGIERRESGRGRFAIIDFYLARARRIIPALAALSLGLIFFGWNVLNIIEFRSLGAEVFSSLIFLSNYKYWYSGRELGGYFEEQELPRWLLHSWSLSVEWQFYIILPILIAAAWKIRPGREFLVKVLGAATLFSLMLSVFETHRDAELAFFSLHTRAWEMLVGSIVFLLRTWFPKPSKWALGVELVGFALVILAILIPQSQTQWPGYRALLPVVGAATVLWADRQNSIWTNTPVAQYLGKISYSLYLWHWPVVIALKYAGVLHMGRWIIFGLALTSILSVFSYYFVERFARNHIGRHSTRAGIFAIVFVAGMPAVSGVAVRLADGVWVRGESEQTQVILDTKLDYSERREECLQLGKVPTKKCQFGSGEMGAVLIGDSHAMSMVNALQAALPDQDHFVLSLISSGCPIALDVRRIDTDLDFNCTKFVDWTINQLSGLNADVPVVVATRASYYPFGPNGDERRISKPIIRIGAAGPSSNSSLLKRYRENQLRTLCEIAAQHTTYVVLPVPEMSVDVPLALWRRKRLGINEENIFISRESYWGRHRYILDVFSEAVAKCGVRLLDPTPYLCSAGKCWGAEDGIPLYFDDDHLGLRGEAKLIPMFKPIWKRADAKHESTKIRQ